MVFDDLLILAKNDGLGGIVFFIILAIIIIISQIQKWQEMNRKRQQMRPPQLPPPPPPPPMPQQQPRPATRPIPKPQRPLQQPQRTLQQPRPTIPAKAPPLAQKPAVARAAPSQLSVHRDVYEASAQTAELSRRMAQAVGSEAAHAAQRAAQERPAITAQELSHAMHPSMLRRSFILTELLAPPLGLRDLQSAQEKEPHERTQRPA